MQRHIRRKNTLQNNFPEPCILICIQLRPPLIYDPSNGQTMQILQDRSIVEDGRETRSRGGEKRVCHARVGGVVAYRCDAQGQDLQRGEVVVWQDGGDGDDYWADGRVRERRDDL